MRAIGSLPRSPAAGAPRSQRTPGLFGHGPDAHDRLPSRASPALPAFRGRKVLQLGFTSAAIDTSFSLSAIPKTSAPFANFQMYAQFHDLISISAIPPGKPAWVPHLPGVRAACGYSGFSCPVGGLPSALSGWSSCFSNASGNAASWPRSCRLDALCRSRRLSRCDFDTPFPETLSRADEGIFLHRFPPAAPSGMRRRLEWNSAKNCECGGRLSSPVRAKC